MFKSALAYVQNFLPRSGSVGTDLSDDQGIAAVRGKWAELVESDFDDVLLHQFAAETRAQDLPTAVFDALLTAGERNVASYFFEYEPQKGDFLDDDKIALLLDTPGLRFASGDGGFLLVDNAVHRAIRILIGYADIDSRGLNRLLLDRNCALVVIALWPHEVFGDEALCQAAAHGTGCSLSAAATA